MSTTHAGPATRPLLAIEGPTVGRWVVIRAWLVRAAGATARRLLTGWRLALTFAAAVRLGMLWKEFTANVGIADQRVTVEPETGRMRVDVYNVPRTSQLRITEHGWTQTVRLRPGHNLAKWVEVCDPLRHTARVQTVKVVEIPNRPGFVQLRVLRRDPLSVVTERPRPVSPSRFVVGAIENGDPWFIDFGSIPHWLICGGTGSGKSGLLACLLAAIAHTDALMIGWDLKWGIEAEAFRPRYGEICTSQFEVKSSTRRVLALAEQRAGIFRELGVRSIDEAAELGVILRRVVLVVDEVAEVALDHGEKDEDGKTKLVDAIQPELLSIVQRVRAFGIHVVLCGQRFGSDLGKSITAIRAQVPGRICLSVNDIQTAEMTLPGYPREVHDRVLTMTRPGLAIVADGLDWHYGRSAFLTPVEVRAVAASTAHRRIDWAGLVEADQAAVAGYRARGAA